MQDEIKTCISAGNWWHDLSGATNCYKLVFRVWIYELL